MSMEHKAFVFDTNLFNSELKEVIIKAVKKNSEKPLYDFIDEHLKECTSPYSEEELDEDWRDELEAEDMQEICDFALTYCYDISDDKGLSDSWDAVLSIMKQLDWSFDAEYYILGHSFAVCDFILDPGCRGTGFVKAADILKMHAELLKNKESFIENITDDEAEDELESAYDELLSLYEAALSEKKGLFLTF